MLWCSGQKPYKYSEIAVDKDHMQGGVKNCQRCKTSNGEHFVSCFICDRVQCGNYCGDTLRYMSVNKKKEKENKLNTCQVLFEIQ